MAAGEERLGTVATYMRESYPTTIYKSTIKSPITCLHILVQTLPISFKIRGLHVHAIRKIRLAPPQAPLECRAPFRLWFHVDRHVAPAVRGAPARPRRLGAAEYCRDPPVRGLATGIGLPVSPLPHFHLQRSSGAELVNFSAPLPAAEIASSMLPSPSCSWSGRRPSS